MHFALKSVVAAMLTAAKLKLPKDFH